LTLQPRKKEKFLGGSLRKGELNRRKERNDQKVALYERRNSKKKSLKKGKI